MDLGRQNAELEDEQSVFSDDEYMKSVHQNNTQQFSDMDYMESLKSDSSSAITIRQESSDTDSVSQTESEELKDIVIPKPRGVSQKR